MQIYWIRAQAPRRVLALAKHLGLQVEYVHMDFRAGEMRRPDYAALNPNMRAPTLVDGEYVLWESSAIMAYLSAKADADLWPADDIAKQIEILRWLSWNDHHWAPAVAPYYFEHVVKPTFQNALPDRSALPSKAAAVQTCARVLNTHLEGSKYVAMNHLTIADFQLASMAAYWRVSEMPFGDYPAIVEWLDRLTDLPAWRSPWPDRDDDSFLMAV
ncbi:MAG: glutathione S-transferase family protein [Bradyrhizobium sp.]|nr:glutathione S-transferase family protein [Bradyrhizobium sp.]